MPGKGRGRGRGRGNFAATPQKTSTSNSGEDFPSLPSDVQPKPMTPWSKPKATTPASSAPASSAPASTTPVPLKTPVGDIVEELAASSIAPVSSESAVTSKLTSAPGNYFIFKIQCTVSLNFLRLIQRKICCPICEGKVAYSCNWQ